LLRFIDLILHQEVPKLLSQQELRGLVDKTADQQPKIQQFETGLGLENFLLKFLDLIIHHEVPKLKLFSQQDLVDKTTTQQPKVQQFESTAFQDPQTAAAETSGSYYYNNSDGEAGSVVLVVASKRKVRGERKGVKKRKKPTF
jgi:hypothetical protein